MGLDVTRSIPDLVGTLLNVPRTAASTYPAHSFRDGRPGPDDPLGEYGERVPVA